MSEEAEEKECDRCGAVGRTLELLLFERLGADEDGEEAMELIHSMEICRDCARQIGEPI